MVYLLSRTAKLLADLNDTGVVLSEKPPEAISLQANDDDGDGDALISLDTIEQITNMSSGKTAELWNTGKTLLEDIERWLRLLKRERTEHERVYLGNLAYANTMKVSCSSSDSRLDIDETQIILLHDVFRRGREDERLQECCLAVLEHCSACSALLNMSIDLTWPVIICSSVVVDNRDWIMNIYHGFQYVCFATPLVRQVD